MRILVFGGSGQLGSALVDLSGDHEILAPPRHEADITDTGGVDHALARYRPDAVINCAAYNAVDRAETDYETAFAINAIAVHRIAAACLARGTVFMTVGTDYVFDGRKQSPYVEDDAPHPLSMYGISKYTGELMAQHTEARTLVVRTSGLYGDRVSSSKGYTFIDRFLTQARAGEPLRVVSDMVCSPTYAGHLAPALLRLLEESRFGLYHAVNVGEVSWHAFATEVLRQAGIAREIQPISSASLDSVAQRPQLSALSIGKLEGCGIAIPSWQDGIRDYLAARCRSA